VRGGFTALLLVQGACVAATYTLVKEGLHGFEPAALIEVRTFVSAVWLSTVAIAVYGARSVAQQLRGGVRPTVVLGVLNAAVPYLLVAWGQRHIDSGVAAIAGSTVPVFTALLAFRYAPAERIRGVRLAGLGLGLLGVGILTGAQPSGGWLAVAGTLAVIGSAFLWSATSIYGQRHVHAITAPVFAAGVAIAGAIAVLVPALLQLPDSNPGLGPIAAAVGLGIVSGVIQFLFYRMLHLYGSLRTNLVVYVAPPFALLFGAVFFDEPIRAGAVAGLVLVSCGVAIASGLLVGRRPATVG
jgi:drug/metabolite transporter (DMT)-like permease